MARYRILEITDKFLNNGKPYYVIQKHKLGLWWSEYFEEHSVECAKYYDRDKAIIWYEYHCDKNSRIKTKVIAQNK